MRLAVIECNKSTGPYKHVALDVIRINGRPSITVLDVTTLAETFEEKYFLDYLKDPKEFMGKTE